MNGEAEAAGLGAEGRFRGGVHTGASVSINKASSPVDAYLKPMQAMMKIFDALHCGAFMLDDKRRILSLNETGILFLSNGRGSDRPTPTLDALSRQLQRQLMDWKALAPVRDAFRIVNSDRPRPILVREFEIGPGAACSLLLIVDLKVSLQPSEESLIPLFGLTQSEAKMARQLAAGSGVKEMARRSAVKQTTVRSHLASIFGKTGTRGQPELVALLARAAILNGAKPE